MRSVNPYTDSVYGRHPQPTSIIAASPPPACKPVPTRADSKRPKIQTRAPADPAPPLPNQPPLVRASLAPQPAPLQARDPHHHVLSLASAIRSVAKDAAAMPPGEKPRQPQLGVAVAKAMARTPLTPKVAVLGPPAGTPLGRRTPAAAAVSSQSPHRERREDLASPTTSYFGSHVTARTGSRQSRVESATTTPTGTPNADKMSDGWDPNSRGLGISPLALSESLRSRHSVGGSPGDSRHDSKFFYASDTKPTNQPAPPRPASVHQKSQPTFFYASDASAASKRITSPPTQPAATPVLGSAQEGVATKFFYANGTPDLDPRLSLQSAGSGSGSSSSTSVKIARSGTSNSAVGYGTSPMASRPASPTKSPSHHAAVQPPLRNSAMSPASPSRGQMYPPPIAPTTKPAAKRRISIDAPSRARKAHARTGSVPNAEPLTVPKYATPTARPSELTSPSLSPGSAQPAMTMASILQMADELGEDHENDEDNDGDSQAGSQSTRKSSLAPEPIGELVANARRERKVQDLEITNASLEAINRTLERQLRKQTNELRRYRRLSRQGGNSAASRRRVTSTTLSESSPVGPSDLSEEESDLEEDEGEEEENSLDGSESSAEAPITGSRSPSSQTPGSKRQNREERRLQLDLTKHRELLIDSQKMNQSLKRCLNWTEELIKEGQKALAYHVKVSEVELYGGRVLAPTYYDYGDDTSHCAESHDADDAISNAESEPEPWIKEPQDRDSGIELPTDGG